MTQAELALDTSAWMGRAQQRLEAFLHAHLPDRDVPAGLGEVMR